LSGKALVVLAHPAERSLSRHFAEAAFEGLAKAGYDVQLLDLCSSGFDPVMGDLERARYYSQSPNRPKDAELLANASALVLVFPTWWFGMPAILTGWIDRIFAPGVAFDHADDFGPIKPRLDNLRNVIVVTTLGSPWWVDWLVMYRPVRRVLKRAVFGLCAPRAQFRMLSLYAAETVTTERLRRFTGQVHLSCRLLG
jgi:NAD(P)H dehydrogenase (quinone)